MKFLSFVRSTWILELSPHLTASLQFDSADSLKYSLTGLLTQSSAMTACSLSLSCLSAAPKSMISWAGVMWLRAATTRRKASPHLWRRLNECVVVVVVLLLCCLLEKLILSDSDIFVCAIYGFRQVSLVGHYHILAFTGRDWELEEKEEWWGCDHLQLMQKKIPSKCFQKVFFPNGISRHISSFTCVCVRDHPNNACL